MNQRRLGIVSLMLVVCCLTASASTRRYALVIGNDSYPGNHLQNARNDARAMAQKLGAMGYVTSLELDVNRLTLVRAINTFSSSLSQGDDVLVYYAGHGLQVNGENMLVPTDFQLADDGNLSSAGYPLSSLLARLMARGTRVKVIILDACRNNPYRHDRSLQTGWSPMRTSADTYLAFGTAPGQTASDDSKDGHGLFTDALLRHLDAPVDIDLMFRAVRLEVVNTSGGVQTPWASSSLVDSFHLDPHLDSDPPNASVYFTPRQDALSTAHNWSRSSALEERGVTVQRGAQVQNDHLQDAQMLAEAAQTQIRGFHFEEAVPILEAVVAIDPHAALALRALGLILHLLGRHIEAQRILDRAIQSDPGDPRPLAYWCLFADPGVYQTRCTPVLEAHPEISSTLLSSALHHFLINKDDAALSEASAALSLNGESAAALMLQGELALDAHQNLVAERAFARANLMVTSGAQTHH